MTASVRNHLRGRLTCVIDIAQGEPTIEEPLRVHLWRIDQLLRHGYPDLHALVLASNRQVDLELARRLSRLGCPPGLAVRILT